MDAQIDFAANHQRRGQHLIERASDRTFGRVLDRHYPVIDLPGFNRTEHVVDGQVGRKRRGGTEVLLRRRLGKCAGRAEIGDLERLLQRQASRHHLAEDGAYRTFRQGTGIGFGDAAQYLRLAFRAIDVAVLDLANALREFRPLRQQLQHLCVDGIDAVAQLAQFELFGFSWISHDVVRSPGGNSPAPARLPAAWRCIWRRACRPPTCGLSTAAVRPLLRRRESCR